jgi:hypothetical protein
LHVSRSDGRSTTLPWLSTVLQPCVQYQSHKQHQFCPKTDIIIVLVPLFCPLSLITKRSMSSQSCTTKTHGVMSHHQSFHQLTWPRWLLLLLLYLSALLGSPGRTRRKSWLCFSVLRLCVGDPGSMTAGSRGLANPSGLRQHCNSLPVLS